MIDVIFQEAPLRVTKQFQSQQTFPLHREYLCVVFIKDPDRILSRGKEWDVCHLTVELHNADNVHVSIGHETWQK